MVVWVLLIVKVEINPVYAYESGVGNIGDLMNQVVTMQVLQLSNYYNVASMVANISQPCDREEGGLESTTTELLGQELCLRSPISKLV